MPLNLFISLAASSLYIYYGYILETNFLLTNILLIFFGTFCCYHFLRLPKSQRNLFRSPKQLLPISSIIITLFCSLQLDLPQFLLLSLASLLVVLYGSLFQTKIILRELPFTKPFIISLVWSLICVGLHEWTTKSLFYFLDCFIFIFLLCIPFDIKDKKEDLRAGLTSFAHLLPNKKLCKLLAFSFLVYTLFIYIQGFSLWAIGSMLLFYCLGLKMLIKEKVRPQLFTVVIEGIILIKSLTVFDFL